MPWPWSPLWRPLSTFRAAPTGLPRRMWQPSLSRSRRSRPLRERAFDASLKSPLIDVDHARSRRSPLGRRRSRALRSCSLARGLFAEMPVEQVFHKLHAPELHYLRVWLDVTIVRHTDLPRPREGLGILDCGLIVERICASGRESLDHMQCIAVKI